MQDWFGLNHFVAGSTFPPSGSTLGLDSRNKSAAWQTWSVLLRTVCRGSSHLLGFREGWGTQDVCFSLRCAGDVPRVSRLVTILIKQLGHRTRGESLPDGVKLNLSKTESTTNTHALMHIHNHLSKGQQKTGQTEIPSKCSTNFETELNAFRGVLWKPLPREKKSYER